MSKGVNQYMPAPKKPAVPAADTAASQQGAIKRVLTWADADKEAKAAQVKSLQERGLTPWFDFRNIEEGEPVNFDVNTKDEVWIADGKFGDRLVFKGKNTEDGATYQIGFKFGSRPARILSAILKSEAGVVPITIIKTGSGQMTRYVVRKRTK